MSLALAGAIVIFFSLLAFWRHNALMFMLAAGASTILGFYWFDTYINNLGLTIGLLLIAYGLCCLGFALMSIFWKGRARESED